MYNNSLYCVLKVYSQLILACFSQKLELISYKYET